MMTPVKARAAPGIRKAQPQPQDRQAAATAEPRMLPREVCAFQMPAGRCSEPEELSQACRSRAAASEQAGGLIYCMSLIHTQHLAVGRQDRCEPT